MLTHGGVQALAAGCDPDRPVEGFDGLLESFEVWFNEQKSHEKVGLSEAEYLLKMVAEGFFPRDRVVVMATYPRKMRWRNIAAKTLIELDDVKLTELEMAILCESDVRHLVWRVYVGQLDLLQASSDGSALVLKSLQRSVRQFHEPWRTMAAIELERRFPGN